MAEDVQPMGRRATMQDWRTFPYFLSWIAESFVGKQCTTFLCCLDFQGWNEENCFGKRE